jgi:hypothetical protein
MLERSLVTGVLIAARGACDEPAHAVEDQKHCIGELRTRPARPGAQLDQEVLEPVGEAAHAHHAHHSGRSLHGVCLAKNPIDRSLIVRCRLEREQPGGDALEVAPGFLDKQRPELVL